MITTFKGKQMIYSWKDYDPKAMLFVDNWLEGQAVVLTGLEDGWNAFHNYWITEGGLTVGKDYWCKVVYINDDPLAVIAFSAEKEKYHIMEIVVKPEMRGKGHGTAMLRELLSDGKALFDHRIAEATAVIFPNNPASQRAFEKVGFVFDRGNDEGDVWYYSFTKKDEIS